MREARRNEALRNALENRRTTHVESIPDDEEEPLGFDNPAMNIDFDWPEQSSQEDEDDLSSVSSRSSALEEGETDDSEEENPHVEFEDYDAEVLDENLELPGEEDHHHDHPALETPLLQQPLYPGSKITLKQALLSLLTLTSRNKHTQQSIEDLLRVVGLLLPEGHLLPPTTYKLFKLLGIDPDDLERHVCENDCYVFPTLDRSEYETHVQEVCPFCDTPRLERKGSVLGPRKKFYSLPLAPQIAALKKRPEFDASVRKMWTSLQESGSFYDSFWGGSLVEPLLERSENLDSFSQLLILCLGMDSVNAFKSSYPVTPVGIRIWNLHPEERGSKYFVLLAALVPGPKVPSNLGPYLEPLLDELIASENEPLVIFNENLQVEERLTLKLVTSIQDQISQIKSTEHIGPSGKCNCWRCQRKSEGFEGTNAGSYQKGYNDQSAFTAPLKTNEEAREKARQVEDGEIEPIVYGIKVPSTISRKLLDFDIVHGHMIDFFHNLQINCPKTFWKDHVLKKVPTGVVVPGYVMSNGNKKIFGERIAGIVATHDMYKKPKDPTAQKMKAVDWSIFIITTSVWAAEGLMPDALLRTWCSYRSAYLNYLEGPLTEAKRLAAREELKAYGRGIENHLGTKACTISNHLVIVEADRQIPITGPISESMGSWVERLMNNLVEQTRRRRIAALPERTMILGYLLDQFIFVNQGEIPARLSPETAAVRDDQDAEPRLLGIGRRHLLSPEERKDVKDYATHIGLAHNLSEIPTVVFVFTRAFFKTEIHSEVYRGVRTRCSHHVAIEYEGNQGPETYYATVHKFILVVIGNTLCRLAYITSYRNRRATAFGVAVIDQHNPYRSGKIVNVASIDRKVIFTAEHPTKILEIPRNLSN